MEYTICTEQRSDGRWKWETYLNGVLIDEAQTWYGGMGDGEVSTYTAWRWLARRKAKRAARYHAKCKERIINPDRVCETFKV